MRRYKQRPKGPFFFVIAGKTLIEKEVFLIVFMCECTRKDYWSAEYCGQPCLKNFLALLNLILVPPNVL